MSTDYLDFGIVAGEWPLDEPIVRIGTVATFRSQANSDWGIDAAFLSALTLAECYYGATDFPICPFARELPRTSNPLTGGDVLRAVKARHFRSEHIATLDASYIPFPGYHPHTENDEMHNDFRQQCVFSHEAGVGEFDGAHGALKHHVADGRLWYVLVHTTPQQHGEYMFSDYVALFVLGKSPHADHCVGVVTRQACHNLCD